MGEKEHRHRDEHEHDLDGASAAAGAHEEQNVQRKESAGAGAGYLGQAQVDSGTTNVTEFKDKKAQSYAHGAFMGAAGAFMKDGMWNQIFSAVWKDEYERVLKIEDTRECMLALENNRTRPASKLSVEIAEAQLRQAKSFDWPLVGLRAAFTRLDENPDFLFSQNSRNDRRLSPAGSDADKNQNQRTEAGKRGASGLHRRSPKGSSLGRVDGAGGVHPGFLEQSPCRKTSSS